MPQDPENISNIINKAFDIKALEGYGTDVSKEKKDLNESLILGTESDYSDITRIQGRSQDFDWYKYKDKYENRFNKQLKASQDPYKALAKDQSWTQSIFRRGANYASNVFLGILETVGELGELPGFIGDQIAGTNTTDFKNSLTEFAKRNKNQLFGESYRDDRSINFDYSDPTWWADNGFGLLESMAQFGLTGASVGGVAAKGASVFSRALKLGRLGSTIVNAGANTLTSASLAYTEGAMSGATVFDQTYKSILDKTGNEEYAKEQASKAAATTVKINTLVNTALNLYSVGTLFKAPKSIMSAKNLGVKRLAGELDDAFFARINQLPENYKPSILKSVGKYAIEAPFEATEEIVNVFAEKEGRIKGGLEKGKSSYAENFIDALTSEEGIVSGIMGAIGGIGQVAALDNAPVSFEDGKPKFGLDQSVRARNVESKSRYYKAGLQALKEDLNNFITYNQNLSEAVTKGDKVGIQSAKDNLFNISASRAIVTGNSDALIGTFENIAKIDNKEIGEDGKTEAMRQGFTESDRDNNFKKEAETKITELKEHQKKFDDFATRYGTQDQESPGYLKHVTKAYLNDYYGEKNYNQALTEFQNKKVSYNNLQLSLKNTIHVDEEGKPLNKEDQDLIKTLSSKEFKEAKEAKKSLEEAQRDFIKYRLTYNDSLDYNKYKTSLDKNIEDQDKKQEKIKTSEEAIAQFTNDIVKAGYKTKANDNNIEVLDRSVNGIHVRFENKPYRMITTEKDGVKGTYLTDDSGKLIKIDGDWIKNNYSKLQVISIDQARNEIRTRRINQIRTAQINSISKLIREYESKRKSREEQIRKLEDDLLELEIDLEQNLNDIKNKTATKSSLNREKKKIEAAISSIENQIEDIRNERARIENVISELQSYKQRLESSNNILSFNTERNKIFEDWAKLEEEGIKPIEELFQIASELDNNIKDLELKKKRLENYLEVLNSFDLYNELLDLVNNRNTTEQWFVDKYSTVLPWLTSNDLKTINTGLRIKLKKTGTLSFPITEIISDLNKLQESKDRVAKTYEDIQFIKDEIFVTEKDLKDLEDNLKEFKKLQEDINKSNLEKADRKSKLENSFKVLDLLYDKSKERYNTELNSIDNVIPSDQIMESEENDNPELIEKGFTTLENELPRSTELWFTTGKNLSEEYDDKGVELETSSPSKKRWFRFTENLQDTDKYYLKVFSPQQQFNSELQGLKAEIAENIAGFESGKDLVVVLYDASNNQPVLDNGNFLFTSISLPSRLFAQNKLNVATKTIVSTYQALQGSPTFDSLIKEGAWFKEGKFTQNKAENSEWKTGQEVLDIMVKGVFDHYSKQFESIHTKVVNGENVVLDITGITQGFPRRYKDEYNPISQVFNLEDSTISIDRYGNTILTLKDGKTPWVDRRKLNESEIDTVLQLISELYTTDSKGNIVLNLNKQLSLPDDKYTIGKKNKLNILPYKKDQPGLLSQLINWGGPKKNMPFKEGHIFINPKNNEVTFFSNGLLRKLPINLVKDNSSNQELRDFLSNKKVNVNNTYLKASDKFMYFNPRVVGDTIKFDKYKNYKEFLTNKSDSVLETNIVKSSEGIQFASRNLILKTDNKGNLQIRTDQPISKITVPDNIPDNVDELPDWLDMDSVIPAGEEINLPVGKQPESTDTDKLLELVKKLNNGIENLEVPNNPFPDEPNKLVPSKVYKAGDTKKAIENLKKIFGEEFTTNDVVIVAGLIDGKSWGRFTTDAKILLSDQLADGVEYHEAFHRVYRTLISNNDRVALIKEFKNRKDYNQLLASKRTEGYNGSDESIIEEIIADEFMDYMLSNQVYKPIESKAKNIFEKIFNFLKKVLGLDKSETQKLFKSIAKGKFIGIISNYDSSENVDKLAVGNITLNSTEKDALMNGITTEVMSIVYNNDKIYEFLKADGETLKSIYQTALRNTLSKLSKKAEELIKSGNLTQATRILEIAVETVNNLQVVSLEHSKYIADLNLKLDIIDGEHTSNDDDNRSDEEGSRKWSDWVNSVEISVEEKMSRAVKLLAATMPKVKEIKDGQAILETNELGLIEPEDFKSMTVRLFNTLATIPPTLDNFINELNKSDLSKYVPILKTRLGIDKEGNYNLLKLQNEFVQAFAKTRASFTTVITNTNGEFKVVNSNTQVLRGNIINSWINKLSDNLINRDIKNKLKNYTKTLNNKTRSELYNLLGFDVSPKLIQDISLDIELTNIADFISKTTLSNSDLLLEFKKKRDTLGKYLNKIADAQAKLDAKNELQIYNAEGKMVYSITLNSYQSQVTDAIKYYMADGKMDLEGLKEYLPNLFNVYSTNAKWVNKAKEGDIINYTYLDGFGLEGDNTKNLGNLKEGDLYSVMLNSLLTQGIYTSMKHADRGMFPAYYLDSKDLHVDINVNTSSMEAQAVDVMLGYIVDEFNRYKLGDQGINNYDKNINKAKGNILFNSPEFSIAWNKLLNDFNTPITIDDIKGKTYLTNSIISYLNGLYKNTREELDKFKVTHEHNGRYIGISKELSDKAIELVGKDKALEHIIKAFTWNLYFGNIEQIKMFSGDLALYSKPDDFFKRLNMQSSTGKTPVVDKRNNDHISKINKETKLIIDGQRINYKPNADGTGKELIFSDNDFSSSILESINKIFDQGLSEELPDNKKTQANNYAKELTSAYSNYVENDGFAAINIFEAREWLHRLGEWNPTMDKVFNREIQYLNILNSELSEDEKKAQIYKLTTIPEEQDVEEWFKNNNGAFVIKKPQYTGPVYLTDKQTYTNTQEDQRVNIVGGRKTSFLVLLPSMLEGTPLGEVNKMMLKQDIGFLFWNSSAKYGTKILDTPFYNKEGGVNLDYVSEENTSVLDYRFLKDQLEISNDPKTQITNATQSTKNMIANIFNNGKPKSDKALEDYNTYVETINEILERKTTKFLKEIDTVISSEGTGFDNMSNYDIKNYNKFKETILRATKDRNPPRNIIEAIENFTNSDGTFNFLESLPNKERINNILSSMITNNVLVIKRPGNSMPQASIMGLETNLRVVKGDKIQSDLDSLNFYEPIIKDGKIIGIKEAGFIIPMPIKWLSWAMKAANTRSVQEAIDWVNDKIDKGELDSELSVKSLRIPNQQLSSNDVFRVKKFLNPMQYQSIAFVPSELVAKTGGDFDIDKLNIYYKNLSKDNSKGFKTIEYLDDSNSTVEERYKVYNSENKFYNFLNSKAGYEHYKKAIDPSNVLATSTLNALFESNMTLQEFDSRIDKNKTYDENLEIAKENSEKIITLEQFSKLPILKQNTDKAIENRLLETEQSILLADYNIRNFLTPVSDDYLKNEIMLDITKKTLGKAYTAKSYGTEMNSWNSIADPINNIQKTIEFLWGSQGIAIVATNITHHPLGQATELQVEKSIKNGTDDDGNPISLSTEIKFDVMEDVYNMSSVYDVNHKQQILEALSALLNTQLDIVKNPYPIALGITLQTLPVITYMVRRGVPLDYILHFVTSEPIQEYLLNQRINESFIAKSSGRKSPTSLVVSNKKLRDNMLAKYPNIDINKYLTLSELSSKDPKNYGNIILQFFNLVDQAKAADDVKRLLSADTKYYKDLYAAKEVYTTLTEDIKDTGLIKPEAINKILDFTFMGNFFEGNKMYYSLFKNISKFESNKEVSDKLSFITKESLKYQKGQKAKDKFLSTFYNDLTTFIIQNNNEQFEGAFSRLFTGDNSLAKRVTKAQQTKELVDNQFIQGMLPEINTRESGRDNLRFKQQGLDTVAINDLLDSLEELEQLDNNLYNDIILFTFMQSGTNNSPFNYAKLLDYYGLNKLKQVINTANLSPSVIDVFWSKFFKGRRSLFPDDNVLFYNRSGLFPKDISPDKNIVDSVFYMNYRDGKFESHVGEENTTIDTLETSIDKILTTNKVTIASLGFTQQTWDNLPTKVQDNIKKCN